MKAIGGIGSVASFPFKGGAVSLESGDMTALIGAASGLVKVLIGAGAGILALAFVSVIAEEERIRKSEQIPIGTMSFVKTERRRFVGIPLEDSLEFTCEGEHFQTPIERINKVGIRYPAYEIEFMDGSTYEEVNIITKRLRFASVAGIQIVNIPQGEFTTVGWFRKRKKWQWRQYPGFSDPNFSIGGVSWSNVNELRNRLKFVLEHNAQAVIRELGEEVFDHFFQYKPTPSAST